MVEGRRQTRSWQATDGTTKYRTEIVAENIQLGPKSSNAPSSTYMPNTSSSAPVNNSAPYRAPEVQTEKIETINLDEFGNPIEETSSVNTPADVANDLPGEPMPF